MKFSDNYQIDFSKRSTVTKEDDLFLKRWSPRSFRYEELDDEVLETIFGAARWTQSCFNEQPWLFVTESGPSDREIFLDLLMSGNQQWAKNASLIGFIFAQKNFTRNGKPNRNAAFDTGAAWMAMTLQARMLGLYTHGMAGIKKTEVFDKLHVPEEEYEILCGFTLGVIDTPENLNENLKEREQPSERKPLGETWIKGIWSP